MLGVEMMKLEIIGEPYALAKIDIAVFKASLQRSWDLSQAIRESTVVIKNDHSKEISSDYIFELIWGLVNWAYVLDNIGHTNRSQINLRLFFVKYEDWLRLAPGEVSSDSRIYNFKEHKDNGKATIIVQDLIPHPDYDIDAFLKCEYYRHDGAREQSMGWKVKP